MLNDGLKLMHGDCLELMKEIPDKSVDMCLTDPPYGVTGNSVCKWDSVIPVEPMWVELKRIVKENGVICLFGVEPFSSHLRLSNLKMYKYDWIWNKVNKFTGFLNAKKRPMTDHEIISIFYSKQCLYNPQKREGGYVTRKYGTKNKSVYNSPTSINRGEKVNGLYPKKILDIPSYFTGKTIHPTQKPVALLEYLIKTYTNENEIVLDFTMGSGSTGVACKNLNRKFVGIEKEEKYFDIAKQRILGVLENEQIK